MGLGRPTKLYRRRLVQEALGRRERALMLPIQITATVYLESRRVACAIGGKMEACSESRCVGVCVCVRVRACVRLYTLKC